jgi:hypothetical protein
MPGCPRRTSLAGLLRGPAFPALPIALPAPMLTSLLPLVLIVRAGVLRSAISSRPLKKDTRPTSTSSAQDAGLQKPQPFCVKGFLGRFSFLTLHVLKKPSTKGNSFSSWVGQHFRTGC